MISPRAADIAAIRRAERRMKRTAVLNLIETRKCIVASDRKELRWEMVKRLKDQEGLCVDYRDVCRALDWLRAKRLIIVTGDKNVGSYAVSPR